MAKKKGVKKAAPKKALTKKVKPKEALPVPVEQRANEVDINSVDFLRSFGYPIPRTFEAMKKKILELRDSGEDSQKHLGILLTALYNSQVHLNDGFTDFVEFCRKVLFLAGGSVRNAMATLKMHTDMGIPPDIFKRLGQGHIHQLYRAYAKGVIDKSGVKGLLYLADMSSSDYISRDKFKDKIDKMLSAVAGQTGAVLKSFALKPDSGEAQEMIESCLVTLKKHPEYREYSQSQVLERALVEFAANHSGDEGAAKFVSLDKALSLTASLTPVGAAPVMIVMDPDRMDEAGLGKVKSKMVTKAYMGFGKGDYAQKLVLTTNLTRAAIVMSLPEKQIRELPIEVDPAILPKMLSKHFETVSMIIEPKNELDLIEAARLIKMPVEDIREYAEKLGYDVQKNAKKEPLLRILFADQELYGFGDMAIEDLMAQNPDRKTSKAKKPKASKPKIMGSPEKAAPKKAEPEEEGEEEPDVAEEAGETEEEGEEETIDLSDEKKARHNLGIFKDNGILTRADFAEKYNTLSQSMTDKEKYDKILEWTRTVANSDRAKKVIKEKNLTVM